ncbi:MAG: addiction module protein [Planctomycetaceae bacterium]
MPASREEVLNAALVLPESDRLAIAVRLMESLPDNQPGLPDDDDLYAELERRSADFDEGSMDWVDLRSELRQSYP